MDTSGVGTCPFVLFERGWMCVVRCVLFVDGDYSNNRWMMGQIKEWNDEKQNEGVGVSCVR